ALIKSWEKHRDAFTAHKLKCDEAFVNALKSSEDEMKLKVKLNKTLEELQSSNDNANGNAIEIFENEGSSAKLNCRELFDDGMNKLNEALSTSWEKHRVAFTAHKADIKIQCDNAVDKALRSYKNEMKGKIQSSTTKHGLQTCNDNAIENAIKKFKVEVPSELYNDLLVKLEQ
ncbi:unnamed protein product, partial [Meganyctiphanes norvegica]